jgi:ferredoxin
VKIVCVTSVVPYSDDDDSPYVCEEGNCDFCAFVVVGGTKG